MSKQVVMPAKISYGVFMLRNNAVELVHLCVACGSVEHKEDLAFSHHLALRPPYAVRSCTKCKLRWLSPRPTSDAYQELYSDEFYFGGHAAPEIYSDVVRGRLHHFAERIKRAEKLHAKQTLDILDVGAATGDFVYLASQRGHRAIGIELSSDARKTAQQKYGIQLDSGAIEQYPKASFDMIHMNHVLEHLPNPQETLAHCGQLLRGGGLIVIEIPQQFDNDLDRLRKVLRLNRQPEFNSYSLHHTYFFSPHNISVLINKTGFRLLSLRTAVDSRTPLWPPSIKNVFLRLFLMLSDRIHKGGNIIEVYALK